MPFSWKIDPDKSCVYFKWRGTLSEAGGVVLAETITENAEMRACALRFHDVRLADLNVSAFQVQRTADRARQEKEEERAVPIKSAVLAPSNISFGMMRMFSALYERPDLVINVFRDIEEAQAWLGLTNEDGDPFETMP